MILRDKYNNDPMFHTMVDHMVSFVQSCQFSPSEMREAAMLASIIYEEHNYSSMVYVERDIEEALRFLHEKTRDNIRKGEEDD